jgi:tellurite methyltransferase
MEPGKRFFEKKIYNRKGYKFKFKPDNEILEMILKLKKSGKVLDLGCGESGTSLALAEKGFEVSCIDISKTTIDAVNNEAKKRSLTINAIVRDLEEFKPEENYDIILGLGIFHFLSKSQTYSLINLLKEKTNKNGIHIIDAFLKGYPSQAKDSIGCYFQAKELKKLYSDWKIINYEEYEEGESKLAWIVARR